MGGWRVYRSIDDIRRQSVDNYWLWVLGSMGDHFTILIILYVFEIFLNKLLFQSISEITFLCSLKPINSFLLHIERSLTVCYDLYSSVPSSCWPLHIISTVLLSHWTIREIPESAEISPKEFLVNHFCPWAYLPPIFT